jgi:hypothetical protein
MAKPTPCAVDIEHLRYILEGGKAVCTRILPCKRRLPFFAGRSLVSAGGCCCEVTFLGGSSRLGFWTNAYTTGGSISVVVGASVGTLADSCVGSEMSFVVFEIGTNLRQIEKRAFIDGYRLLSICIPASVEILGEKCLSGCLSLSSLTFASASQLRLIDRCAVSSATSLTSVTLPASLEVLGESCFAQCSRLRRVARNWLEIGQNQ